MKTLKIELSETRRAIIAEPGHILVTGGPGCGKTTVALLKAKERAPMLEPEQAILFLSFSRAAVQQIRERMRSVLGRKERERIEVSTYHLFCLRILETHGRLLNGRTPRILYPAEERLRKSENPESWDEERKRMAEEEGIYVFDFFAPMAATLLERSAEVRALLAAKYPLVMLDEFQDTNDDQWRVVRALARQSTTVCLADPDQRIFGYQGNIDPARIEILVGEIQPRRFDLGADNHRSPTADILTFADAVLRNKPLPQSKSVKVIKVSPRDNTWVAATQYVVNAFFDGLRAGGVDEPSIAVLARANADVALLSGAFRGTNEINGKKVLPVPHEILWDAELATSAGQVIASIMESPGHPPREAASLTLRFIAEYYLLKHAERPSQGAKQSAADFVAASQAVLSGQRISKKAPRLLAAASEQQIIMTGSPVDDWLSARSVLESVDAIKEIANSSRMLRLFNASDLLAAGLHEMWLRQGNYAGAAAWLRRTLDRERLADAERAPRGCILMNMHKSKGKEFDAVVIVEPPHRPLISTEPAAVAESRRLLRVAITRARHQVAIIRTQGAAPLTG